MNKLFSSHPLLVDKHLAKILGLNEALILQQVHYWLTINQKNNRNYHKNRYWTYNTLQEWHREFPFWSEATIKRTFKKLREANLILTDNFNSYQMDRTLWYTINYEALEKLMMPSETTTDHATPITEEHFIDTAGQNNQLIGSSCVEDQQKNEPMDGALLPPPLPEISTEITPEISNPSISPAKDEDEKGPRDRSANEFEKKYSRVVEKCELFCIDEKYREAVGHAIKLLLLDTEKNKPVKIGNNYIPVNMVERDIHRLDFFTTQHAVNKFKEASAKIEIRNTIAYLKACIYNAINEMNIEVDSQLRYAGAI